MTIHQRDITPRPSTADPEARTVEAIVSTGADVQRAGFIERLPLDGCDPRDLIGQPVLDGHRSDTTRDQLGVIVAAEIRPEGLWARIKFRGTPAAQQVFADIAEGTLRGLSIGYRVEKWRESREGGKLIRTAVKWTPVEASVVPLPADAGAHFRSQESTMPEAANTTTETTEDAQVQTRAQINAEIRSIARTAGMDSDWADAQIDAEADLNEVRAAALTAMQERSANANLRTARATIGTDHDAPEVRAERMGEALYARMHPTHELSAPARQYAHLSIAAIASHCLRHNGGRATGLAADTVITRALHSTSDFPLILGDAVNRNLRRAYDTAPSGVRPLARQTTHRDFRDKHMPSMGPASDLEKVNEAGEFKSGTIEEARESYRIETFGKIFGISRQALINDDLGAFASIPKRMGIAARAFENAALVSMITSNPLMADAKGVFHADHTNVSTHEVPPAVLPLDAATLSAARLAMRRQTGLSGELIDVTPRYLLVAPELETEAEKLLAEITAAKTEDVNPFGKLTLLTDPRLTDPDQFYLAADPATVDGLEYAYLEGAPGPQIETKAGFEVDGMQVKVRLDFGAGWIDYRGWHRVN